MVKSFILFYSAFFISIDSYCICSVHTVDQDIKLKRKKVEWDQHNFIVFFILFYFILHNLFISFDSYYAFFQSIYSGAWQ